MGYNRDLKNSDLNPQAFILCLIKKLEVGNPGQNPHLLHLSAPLLAVSSFYLQSVLMVQYGYWSSSHCMNCSLEVGGKAKGVFLSIETGAFEAGFLETPSTLRLTSHLVICPHITTRETGKCRVS